MRFAFPSLRAMGIAGVLLSVACAGHAVSAEDSGAGGGRITLIVGLDAGGGYDIMARFVAPYLSKHLPGQPRIVVQNMPGAGSLVAANYLFNIAPRDGSTIGMVDESVPLTEMLGQAEIKYEADKFGWIGRVANLVSLVAAWHASPVQSMDDAKLRQATINVGGPVSGSTLYVTFSNALLGTHFKKIPGYSSREALLALERGELDIDSSVDWIEFKTSHAAWLKDNLIKPLFQIGLDRHADLPEVPLLTELASDDADKTIFRLISASDAIGRSLLTPPGLPQSTLDSLRRAFDATMKDPDFLAAAEERHFYVQPLSGENLASIIATYKTMSPQLIDKVKAIIQHDAD